MPHNDARHFLRQYSSFITLGQRCLDAGITIAYLVGLPLLFPSWSIGIDLQALAIVSFLLSWMIFGSVGLYRPLRTLNLDLLTTRLLAGWSTLIIGLLLLGFLTHTSNRVPPAFVFTWSICSLSTLLGLRLVIWPILKMIRAKGWNHRSAVIAGLNEVSVSLVNKLNESPQLGIKLAGFFDDAYVPELQDISPCQWLGALEQLPIYVQNYGIDVVYITCSTDQEEAVMPLLQKLQDTTACVYYVPSILTFHLTHGRPYDLNGIPLVSIWEVPFSDCNSLLKRLFDVVVSGLALLVLAPVMAVIAIAVKLSSPGPVLFRQQRYGLNGKEITVFKFRTMRVMEDGPVIQQAQRGDRRITRVGAFLRKTSLDELPQFINVLQGHMSVVGPRPHAVAHNEMYRKLIEGYMLRHKVKPGITGLAQVRGCRGETETLDKMQQRVQYDLEYIRSWSLSLDVRILLRTCLVVWNDQNAY